MNQNIEEEEPTWSNGGTDAMEEMKQKDDEQCPNCDVRRRRAILRYQAPKTEEELEKKLGFF